jgi:acetylornithine deacetylase
VPGENRSQIQKIVEKTVHGVAETDPWLREHPPTLEWFGIQADPWYLEPSSPLVNTVVSAVEKVRKEKAELVGTTGTADSRFSEYFGIPCVMFGPGGDNSHGIDEYVDLDTLSSSVKIIALAVLEWCSVNKAT